MYFGEHFAFAIIILCCLNQYILYARLCILTIFNTSTVVNIIVLYYYYNKIKLKYVDVCVVQEY
jgi:hypothetical protein